MSSFGELLKEGTGFLQDAGVPEPRADAERLLMDLLNVSRAYLFLHGKDEVPTDVEAGYRGGIRRRAGGEPVQYITGMQEFMGLPFRVCPDVLIPRLDTEVLVELALESAGTAEGPLRILDMCCGSGAIAVSMAHALPKAEVTACDISLRALKITSENAARNGVADRIRTLRTDMFRGLNIPAIYEETREAERTPVFDMILCNPPYIASAEIETLSEEVRDHEPRLALDGGADGLRFYRILASEAGRYLRQGGSLFMEIGYDQDRAVRDLLKSSGDFRDIGSKKDLAGKDRIVYCKRI